jgi:hypothetical protein
MLDTRPLCEKEADPNLDRAWDSHKGGLAWANEGIFCVGESLSYVVVVALSTPLERHE